MSTELKFAFTNTSEWLFPTNPLKAADTKNVMERNKKILNAIFKSEDNQKVSRSCFDKCVSDFSNTNFSSNEQSCLRNCTMQVHSLMSDFSFSTTP